MAVRLLPTLVCSAVTRHGSVCGKPVTDVMAAGENFVAMGLLGTGRVLPEWRRRRNAEVRERPDGGITYRCGCSCGADHQITQERLGRLVRAGAAVGARTVPI